MANVKSATLVLIGAAAAVGLTGCERMEQAASDVVEKAKQSAVEAIDQTRQSGSIENVTQSADGVLLEVKQQAAGLLDQASRYLRQGQPENPGTSAAPAEPLSGQ